jgi:hypothetical protein
MDAERSPLTVCQEKGRPQYAERPSGIKIYSC